MNTKYYANGFGVTFYFDEPIGEKDLGSDKFHLFQDGLDSLEGVESVNYKRYAVDITYGLMFGPRLMLNRTARYIKDFFNVKIGDSVNITTTAERGLTQEYYHFVGEHDA